MLDLPELILEMRLTLANGQEMRLRRCGRTPDLFADENGRIFQLETKKPYKTGKHKAIKYIRGSVSVKNLVADAWMAGWDDGLDPQQVYHLDGDTENCAPSNLGLRKPQRGRPRGGRQHRMLLAVECYRLLPDLKLVAEELDMPQREVKAAILQYAPELFSTPPS